MLIQPQRSRSRAIRLGAVSALALAAASQAAQAQDAAAGDAGKDAAREIVVTGIRHSITESINTKRDSLSIVESVTAEDIGKLPNVSIAETLATIPGLAAQRVNGQAEIVSIRGFSPDFTTTLLNGRPQASSGYNRAVEFDQYPAELIGKVDVYKTPNLDLAGMGLSGTTNMQTVRPLEYGKQTFAVNAFGQVNSLGHVLSNVSNKGVKLSAAYIGQFADNTLGIAIGFAHLDQPSVTQHTKDWYFSTFSNSGWPCTSVACVPAANIGQTFLSGFEVYSLARRQVRNGATATIEWKPSDRVHNTFDLYYSHYNQTETQDGVEGFLFPGAANEAVNGQFTNVGATQAYGGTTFATNATYNAFSGILDYKYNTHRDSLFAVGDRLDFEANSRTSLALDLSYSRSHAQESYTELFGGYGIGGTGTNPNRTLDTLTYTFSPSTDAFPSFVPGLDYSNVNQVSLGGGAGWGSWGQDGTVHNPDVKEDLFAADLGGEYRFESGPFSSLHFGANVQRTVKSKFVDEFNLFLNNNRAESLISASDLFTPTNLSYGGFGNILAPNIPAVVSGYYTEPLLLDTNHYAKAWAVRETLVTLRGKAVISAGKLHGDLGTQVVITNQSSTGTSTVTGPNGAVSTPVPTAGGAKYVDVLPNLNLIYDLQSDLKLRFSAGRTMARPRMDDMIASYQISLGPPPCTVNGTLRATTACFGGTAGNPQLRPYRATALDLSVEKYFGGATYLSLAGFYKHLDSYIYNEIQPYDFTGVPTPGVNTLPAGTIILLNGYNTYPANAKGGNVWGIEVSGALDFAKLYKALSGFGVIGSYSHTESKIVVNDQTIGTLPSMPGLSKDVYSLTGYYEKNGYQARVNYRYRSAYLGEVVQLFGNLGYTQIQPDKQLDAQIGYKFPKTSRLAGVSITAQALNILNNTYRARTEAVGGATTANGTYLPEVNEKYGVTYLMGIGYKF